MSILWIHLFNIIRSLLQRMDITLTKTSIPWLFTCRISHHLGTMRLTSQSGLNHSNSFAINGTISPSSLHVIHTAILHPVTNTLTPAPHWTPSGLGFSSNEWPVRAARHSNGGQEKLGARTRALRFTRTCHWCASLCSLCIHLIAEYLLLLLLRLIITLWEF